ncbi:plasmid mobilization relaxosome protein MobC [Nesterenkonia jeotgali]|uniref:Putative DNA-binding protein n=1 Tax=Nesterenkonia jeotgali TaxID=317018 RepID=A0A839FPA1_9MICC|nr:plasmid mobilization relaxosome protein MobC [Nesterenkonia jeotgali]MBA8921339.1 putative DNA-binding protein [Nesterenkonia jeotgali]
MSAAKTGAPTTEGETRSDEQDTAGGGAAVENGLEARSESAPVSFRMTGEALDDLGYIASTLGENRSAAVRSAITLLADALRSADTAEAAQKALVKRLGQQQVASVPIAPDVDQQVLQDLRDALRDLDDGYRQRARELQYVGHNWNQLARWANSGKRVDTDAINAVKRELNRIETRIAEDSRRDVEIRKALSWLA